MLSEEFYDLLNFTELEVGETGANFGDVSYCLMLTTQTFRTNIARRVHICKNGLTTGKHDAEEHPNGIAIDFYLDPRDGKVDVKEVVFHMILAGFKGIGVYINKNGMYTFHGDLGRRRDWFRDRRNSKVPDQSIFNHRMLK
jgi:hypothetical protein